MANTTGTAGNDHLNGGSGSDTLNGLGGNDRINAGSGNDVVDGGSGSDDVKGDSGDDLLIYRLAENAGATDIYDGGSHIDTLRLVLTRAEWMRADVQADIAVYLAFIAAETNPNNGQASNREFRFTAFDLRVSKVEKLEVTVDGVAIDPRDQAVTLVADAVTTDEDSASASFDVMSNDSVPDLVKSFSHTQGAHGSVAFITSFNDPAQPPSARFVYTPDPTYWDYLAVGESATDSFTYTVTDADGDTQTVTVTVTVTGSNDAPIVTSASQSGAVDEKAEPGEGGTLTATGTVTFTDADLSDTHTASVTARVVTGQAIANGHALTAAQLDALKDAFSIQPVAQSAGGGSVGWSYAIADGALDHLGAGDSVTLKFTVRIDDGEGGSATQDVTITVTGTNDAPTLAAGGDAVGSVTEDQSSPTLGDNGSFGFDDADLSDLHTVSVGSPAVTTTSGVAPGFVPAGGFGTLTAAITESAADQDSAGSVGWSFSIDNAAVQALAHGQRVTQVYTLTIADGNGGTVTRDVTIEIIGTNDAPVVTGAVTGNAVEDGGSSTLNALHNASDVDAGTTLSVVLTHTLPAGVIYDVAAKTFYLQSTHSAFQNLEAGETRTVTVDYGVSDGIVTVPAQAIFTITGTNDAPVITSGVAEATGLVSEAGHLDNGTVVSGTPSVSRTLTATDVDNGATRTWSGNTEGTYGTFAIDPNTGTWTYTLDNSRAATQALREGQSVTESFTATVTDQHGASDSETIAVTIHGTNDRPVITSAAAAAQGSVVEAGNNDDGSVFAGTPGATGQLASSDVDSLATAAWSGSANGTYGTFAINPTTGVWSYTLDNNRAATQSLSEGQSAVETFTATVTDDKGATAIQMVTVTVNGGNDRPTVSAVTGSAVEDGPPVLISLAGDDIDADDNQASLTYNIVGGPAAGTAVILGSSLSFDPGSAFQHLGAGQTQQVTITYSATDAHGAISQGAGPVTTLARFDMADLTSSRSLAADIVAPGIIVSSLTAVGALTGTPFSNHFYLAGWGNTLDTSKYYEVTINPNGKTIDFDSVRFSIENAGPNTSTWYLRSSVDGFASSIATGTVNGQDVTKFTASLGNLALASGPITFRWYFTSPGGTTGFANHEPGGAGGGLPDVGQDLIFTGSIGSDTATITVTGVNDAPVVTGTVTGNATEDGAGVTLNALANASDVDQGTVLQVVNVPGTLPAGVSYNAATKSFTLSPAHAAYQALALGQTTTVSVNYGVSDGIATTPASVRWTVTGINDAPVVSGAVTGNATEDGAGVTLSALANASDVDQGTVLQVVNVPGTLPAGVSYNATTRSFTLDPAHSAYQSLALGQTTTVSVNYGVSDGIATTPASVSWTVIGTNDAPEIVPASIAGSPVEFQWLFPAQASEHGFPISDTVGSHVEFTSAEISDATPPFHNGYFRTDLTADGQIIITFEANVTWTATEFDGFRITDVGGTLPFILGASDSDPRTTLSVSPDGETVYVNWAGKSFSAGDVIVINMDLASGKVVEAGHLDDGTFVAGTPSATGTLTATDLDASATAVWSVAGSVNGTYGTFAIDPSTGIWTYTLDNSRAATQALAEGQIATETFTARVTDDKGASDVQALTIAIIGTNDAPTVTGAVNASAVEDGPAVTLNALANASDPDAGDALQVTNVPGTLPAGVSFNAGAQTFTLDPSHADYQSLALGQTIMVTVTYTVTDGDVTVPASVSWTVTGINDAPVLINPIADQSSPEDAAWSFQVPTSTFTDIDHASVNYTATMADGSALPSWLAFNGITGTFTGTPPTNFNGAFSLKVTATDGGGLSATDTFSLTVTPVDDPLVQTADITDKASNEDAFWSYTVPAGTFADPDNMIAYSATQANGTALPSWLSFNAATQTFSGTPPANFNGVIGLKLTATAGTQTLSDSFNLNILPVADMPTLSVGSSTSLSPTNGAAVMTTLSLTAGEVLSLDWNFIAGDYMPYNDFSWVSINGVVSTLALVEVVGDFGGTGWRTFSFTAPTTDSYTIAVGVSNVNDTALNSHVLVDNVRVNGTLVNSFEGSFGSWSTTGSAFIVSSFTPHSPTDGSTMVRIESAGNSTSGLESFAGAGAGSLALAATPSGFAGKPITVPVTVTTVPGELDDTYIVITGYPAGATFNLGAFDAGLGGWKVMAADLGGNLKMTTLSSFSGTVTLSIKAQSYAAETNSTQTTAIKTIAITVLPPSGSDPVVFDLDGDGISFLFGENAVAFDLDADGVAEKLGWMEPGDGLLVLDSDGSGAIENGSEVVSEAFLGLGFASSAEALASLDSNADGVLDGKDERFGELRLWIDANSDGVSQAGELKSLAELGIASLSLDTAERGDIVDRQEVLEEGGFTRADGSSGTFVFVHLTVAPEAPSPPEF